jgi:ribose-phosphate pyrophosphokinase
MEELYNIPCSVVHSSGVIAQYICAHVNRPLLVGPDSESRQWVSEVAAKAGAPFIVLEKERVSDNEVIIHVNAAKGFEGHTPVLVDDIISTAHTMTETVKQLRAAGLNAPVCLGVHAVFSGSSYRMLLEAGVKSVVTCDTIPHRSGLISVAGLLGDEMKRIRQKF